MTKEEWIMRLATKPIPEGLDIQTKRKVRYTFTAMFRDTSFLDKDYRTTKHRKRRKR